MQPWGSARRAGWLASMDAVAPWQPAAAPTSCATEFSAACPAAVFNGAVDTWCGPILNVSFPGYAATELTGALDLAGVCVARGSACLRQTTVGSPVVAAAYPGEPWRATTATRWSIGFDTTDDGD